MSACSTCGKCPCYEHERKTVMVDPKPRQPGGRHEERMAELLEDFRTNGNDDVATFHELHEYADELAAKLEAEREAHAAALQVDEEALTYANDRLKAAEKKLLAATAVVRAARTAVTALRMPGDKGPLADLLAALMAFDAINPDGSTGGANPAK